MAKVLIINKEKDMTSRDVVNIVSKKYKTRAVGHNGTLDPLATGVLVVCLDESVKLVPYLTSLDKEYVAEVTLGYLTDTLDNTGKVTETSDISKVTDEQIKKVISEFPSKYEQEVPIFSAIKINGKKLYEYARENIPVKLPKREVCINTLELVSKLNRTDKEIKFSIKTSVSKGTYIRSLIRDIGDKLGVHAVMSELARTKQGAFKLEDCISMDEIGGEIPKIDILPFLNMKQELATKDLLAKMSNGGIIDKTSEELILFYDSENIVSVYEPYYKDNKKMKPVRVFNNIKRVG